MLGHVFEGETQRVAVSHSLSRRLRFHLEHGTPPNRAGKTSMSTAFPPRARNAVRPETGVRDSGTEYPTRSAYGLAAAGVQDSGTESRTIPPRVLFTGPRRTTGVNVKVRVAASAVLAAAVTLAASGCTLTAYQATLAHYEPSDGVSASVGSLDIRNILVVSADGSVGNLIMTVINTGTEDVALGVQPGAGGVTQTVRVPAGSTVSLGTGTADAATGSTVSPTST